MAIVGTMGLIGIAINDSIVVLAALSKDKRALAGGSFWPPVAVSIAGGVAGATVLALLFVPTAFAVLHREERAPREAPSLNRMPAEPAAPLVSIA